MKYFNLLILAVSLSIAPQALANNEHSDENEDKYPAFIKRGMNVMSIPYKEENNNEAKTTAVSQYFFGHKIEEKSVRSINIFRDPFPKSDESDGKKAGEFDEKAGLKDDTIKHNTYMLPVFGARRSLMDGDALYKGWEKDLEGDTTLYAIAISQVEPGIAQGMQLANATVDSALANSYRAYNTFMQQPFENEEVGKKMRTIFNQCIYKHLKGGDSKGSMSLDDGHDSVSEGTYDKVTWIAAVAKCLGDTGIAPEGGLGGGGDDDNKLKADDTMAKEKELKNKLHPSHSENAKNAIVKDKVSVASELFNFGDGSDETKRKSLYEAWLTMFGDYEFKIPEDSGSGDSSGNNVYEIEEKRIHPEKSMGQLAEILVKDRYKDMMNLGRAYCQYKKKELDSGDGEEVSDEQTFWTKENFTEEDNQKRVFRLSTPEKVLSGHVIETLALIVYINTDQAGESNSWDKAAEFFQQNQNLEGINLETISNDANRDVIFFARAYAHYVAMSQLLRSVNEAVKFIHTRTVGTSAVNPTIADRAIRLVDDVVDIKQLSSSMIENAQSWDVFVTENLILAQEKINNALPGLGSPRGSNSEGK